MPRCTEFFPRMDSWQQKAFVADAHVALVTRCASEHFAVFIASVPPAEISGLRLRLAFTLPCAVWSVGAPNLFLP